MSSLLAFFQKLDPTIERIDCNTLRDVLFMIDANWFKKRNEIGSENWVIRFNSISRLYKLMIGYYQERISPNTEYLEKPNLTLIARENNENEIYKFGVLVLALAVQSPQKTKYVSKIQEMGKNEQADLMEAVKGVVEKLKTHANKSGILLEYQKMPTQPVTSQIWRLEGRSKQISVLSAENEALREENQRLLDLIQGGHTFQADVELKAQISNLNKQIESVINEKEILMEENLKLKQDSDIKNEKKNEMKIKDSSLEVNLTDYNDLVKKLRESEAKVAILKRNESELESFQRRYQDLMSKLDKSLMENEVLRKQLKKMEETRDATLAQQDASLAKETLELNAVSSELPKSAPFNNIRDIDKTRGTEAENVRISLIEEKSASSNSEISGGLNELASLRNALQQKEAEIQHIKSSTKREQRLMMSAWYELGLQFQRELPSSAPISWLAQQRQFMSQTARRGF